jgi:hypothetical protein
MKYTNNELVFDTGYILDNLIEEDEIEDFVRDAVENDPGYAESLGIVEETDIVEQETIIGKESFIAYTDLHKVDAVEIGGHFVRYEVIEEDWNEEELEDDEFSWEDMEEGFYAD